MAELIDKGALMEKLNVFNDRVHGNEHFIYGIETAKELLEYTPTVTEAEIRAKAIDEMVERIKIHVRVVGTTYLEDIDEIAEQLKEE